MSKISSIFKNLFTIKISRWLQFNSIRLFTKSTLNIVTSPFKPEQAEHKETFEESMQRLGINQEDLNHKITSLEKITKIYLIISFFIFAYSVYLSTKGLILGFISGLGITFLSLATAFRHSFWCFQMKQKKLGLTFKDWLNNE